MILYLTYNDQPSGVYWSQVTDVVEHLNTLGGPRVKLVALVSGRGFWETRRKIKTHNPSAWVIPMVPTMARWRRNSLFLAAVCRRLRPSGIICRGPFATWMALRMRDRGLVKRVCFDGRGAYAAEWEEYRIIDDDALIAQFRPLEQQALGQSDFRIAVSEALVQHWRERYAYAGTEHVVIPCTLGTSHLSGDGDRERVRAQLGYTAEDVVLAYAGSTAGWQSFALLEELLTAVLAGQPQVKVFFLSRADANNSALAERFPGRVRIAWLAPEQVSGTLSACDRGLLIREDTVTNRVSSPTKFAEYLAAGLPVLISPHIGDFSALVRTHGLGLVLDDALPSLEPVTEAERVRCRSFAKQHFTKVAYDNSYRAILQALA
ncbi:MAG TPA: hypothetical protein VGE21_05135 [Flavobacteriales bacterium]